LEGCTFQEHQWLVEMEDVVVSSKLRDVKQRSCVEIAAMQKRCL